jgi:membrane protease YdiL (CAAX protease family)
MGGIERHALFRWGVVITTVHSVLWLLLILVGGLLGTIGLEIALDEARGDEELAVGLFGALGALALAALAVFMVLKLVACRLAWRGSRGWTWCLLVLSVITLTIPGTCLSPIVGLLSILGCIAWLEELPRERPAHGDERPAG